jgi:hypothetical protein
MPEEEVENTHRHLFLGEADAQKVFRITLRHGFVIRVRQSSAIDASVYGYTDGWCAHVVELLTAPRELDFKLFHPRSGIDFYECDIVEIFDESTQQVVFTSTA